MDGNVTEETTSESEANSEPSLSVAAVDAAEPGAVTTPRVTEDEALF